MTVERNPDPAEQPSSPEKNDQPAAPRFVGAGVFLLILAWTVAHTLVGCNESSPPAAEQTASPPSSEPQNDEPGPGEDAVSESLSDDLQTEQLQAALTAESNPEWKLSEYVGSQACVECHAEIAETYFEHPMALTMATIADASPIEITEGDVTEFEAEGCRYRVERDGDRMIHTELMTDDDGNVIYEQSVDVDYASGSGVNARTYLIDRGGLLFESPITWYTEGQRWDLSPGYHDNPRERFNRRITDGCVQCHSGLPSPVGDGTGDLFHDPPFLETGIGCERCHGPGRTHVEQFESEDWDGEDLQIVNPASLDDRRLQDSVCYQCHMEGQHRVLRHGRSYHDFRPGMATEEIWTVFVSPTPFEADGTARFTSHVEQMQASRCFIGTEGAMSCTTCHDPHHAPRADERVEYYRQRCNSCHSEHGCSLPLEEREAAPAFDSCIHCHMPVIGSSNIPHTSLSDHRILRDPGDGLDPVKVEQSLRGLVWSIFDGSDERMPEWEVQRTKALALSDQGFYEMNQRIMGLAVDALEEVWKRDPEDLEVLRRLAFLYGAANDPAKAKASFIAALKVDPLDEKSLKNLGLMSLRTGATEPGLQSYERYLQINKWDGTVYGPYAALLAQSGNRQAAVEAVKTGLELDPTQQKLRGLAVQLYGRLGDQQESARQRQLLLDIKARLDPWDQKRLARDRQKMQESLQEP